MQSTYCTSIPAREGWGKERERNVISRALSAWSPQRGSREKNVHDHRRERQSACCAQTATALSTKVFPGMWSSFGSFIRWTWYARYCFTLLGLIYFQVQSHTLVSTLYGSDVLQCLCLIGTQGLSSYQLLHKLYKYAWSEYQLINNQHHYYY